MLFFVFEAPVLDGLSGWESDGEEVLGEACPGRSSLDGVEEEHPMTVSNTAATGATYRNPPAMLSSPSSRLEIQE
ncbi:hypothetical protein [Streptomyces axinellae]|uniref:Uncharacterized protein n=1 Tax=Streptomyces axinellae TaxID=552788 RepID=A0ABP6CGS3_9ACTN